MSQHQWTRGEIDRLLETRDLTGEEIRSYFAGQLAIVDEEGASIRRALARLEQAPEPSAAELKEGTLLILAEHDKLRALIVELLEFAAAKPTDEEMALAAEAKNGPFIHHSRGTDGQVPRRGVAMMPRHRWDIADFPLWLILCLLLIWTVLAGILQGWVVAWIKS